MWRPWMAKHQPIIRWSSGGIDQWSNYCFQHCLQSFPVPPQRTAILGSTTIESPEITTKVNLPEEYRAFQDFFSKVAATKLPPHRPWDCAIDLLPGTKLPKGRIYPLLILERKAMEEYIKEALQQGVHPSIHLSGSFQFLLHGQEGWWAPTMYWLSQSQLPNSKVCLPPTFGTSSPRGTAWSSLYL